MNESEKFHVISDAQLKAVLNILLGEVQDRVTSVALNGGGDIVTAILVTAELSQIRREIQENSFI